MTCVLSLRFLPSDSKAGSGRSLQMPRAGGKTDAMCSCHVARRCIASVLARANARAGFERRRDSGAPISHWCIGSGDTSLDLGSAMETLLSQDCERSTNDPLCAGSVLGRPVQFGSAESCPCGRLSRRLPASFCD